MRLYPRHPRLVRALPLGVTPVVLARRGVAWATRLTRRARQGLDYVIRMERGTVISPARGRRGKLGGETIAPGDLQWYAQVRTDRALGGAAGSAGDTARLGEAVAQWGRASDQTGRGTL
jgi:hypothetical protein